MDWDWCFLLLQKLLYLYLAHNQPLPSSRLNGGCYGNFGRGIKVRLPGEVKRAVNPPFLSPRELGRERTVVVTRRRSGRLMVDIASAQFASNLMFALFPTKRHKIDHCTSSVRQINPNIYICASFGLDSMLDIENSRLVVK